MAENTIQITASNETLASLVPALEAFMKVAPGTYDSLAQKVKLRVGTTGVILDGPPQIEIDLVVTG